ncbi:methyltransferase domain-containing protein [Nakamurella sp. YIM 132087]|uniref:Methyltransferase domain-containing protein n=1 Tax=Nakamurella alba TaxID=2665158 RepID=A0A7K1FLC5_9ACTN|nr:methyltransferase domain-containing protein [Nakamurella alba]
MFDHHDPGTSESTWSTVLPAAATPLDPSGFRRVVVLAAHPDDESLGAAGLMARATDAGLPVVVVVATAGERSHPDSPTHTPEDLTLLRRREVFEAVGRVAPTAAVQLLCLPDGGLSREADRLRDAVADVVRSGDLVVAPWRSDGHPDHAAVGAAAAEVAARCGAVLWEYPIWMWHWSGPDDPAFRGTRWGRVDLEPDQLRRKRSALACHGSQVRPLSTAEGDEVMLRPGFLAHFRRDHEVFAVPDEGAPDDETSLDAPWFDDFYRAGEDPWGFRTRWYEERKRAVTMASLPRRRFRSAFEPGCALGVLTADLAERCDAVLATDISETPLVAARERLGHSRTVRLEQLRVPQEWPDGRFDLIVLSEIGYYCSRSDLASLAGSAARSLTQDGVLVACHWRHPVAEYPLGGDEVHRILRAETGLRVLVEHVEEDFRLEVLVGRNVRSVAAEEGLS